MRFIIYGLVDPRTFLVRYVGLSSDGLRRPAKHREPRPMRERNYKTGWIKNLRAAGLDYTIVILEAMGSKEALADAERWWIAFGRACGWPLTNLTDGGDGARGYKMTPEVRAKLRAANIGKKQSAETVARRVAKTRGLKRSAETLARMSAWQIGKKLSPETKAKISAAHRRNHNGP